MDDIEFVQRCIRHEKEAWEQFLQRYSRLIFKYIHSVCDISGASLERSSLNDVFQEIVVSLLDDDCRRLRSFKGYNGCSFASWLRQVTVNATIDHFRRNKKKTVSINEENSEELSLSDILPAQGPSATDEAKQKETLRALTECIQRLDTEDRFFVEMHFMRSFALEALRELFTVERGTVDMRKSRIIGRLRDCFRDKGVILV